MSASLTEDDLRGELYFHTKPLSAIKDIGEEWLLGTWTLSKSHRTWRSGYGHPLVEGARISTQTYELDGTKGVAIIFESNDQPPWHMLGWVPMERAAQAEDWAKFLNSEIANRIASLPAGKNWTEETYEGKAAMDYEDKLADEKAEEFFKTDWSKYRR